MLNVAPEVTFVGPITDEGDRVAILFWVRDHEEDAVDLTIELVQGSTETPIEVGGGHGIIGVTSDRDAPGRPHLVYWTNSGTVSRTDPIRLRFTAADTEGAVGRVFETVEFTLDAGLPAPSGG